MPTRLLLILLISTLLGARSVDPHAPSRQGKDFALFFAVDTYLDPTWTDLNNPVRDAEAIAEELETHFGFETEIHRNPGYNQIRQVLRRWQKKTFDKDEQLFVFFSGHGAVDSLDDRGYFMPNDAQKNGLGHYSLESLKIAINRIPCPHILLAIDACYSGTILLKGDSLYDTIPRRLNESPETWRARIINTELTYPSRFILTSGGRERTPDGQDHSPFTKGILNALAKSLRADGIVIWEQLVFYMRKEVKNPRPRYGIFGGHRDGGGFVFVRTDIGSPPIIDSTPAPIPPQPEHLDKFPLPKMIEIPGGYFDMGYNAGTPNEKPVHRVEISRFFLSETEITNAQYCAFLNANAPPNADWGGWMKMDNDKGEAGKFIPHPGMGNHPVVNVSYLGAKAYCEWLSLLSGEDYRIPTEAEWEYAAGGGSLNRTKWSGTDDSNEIHIYGNYSEYGAIDKFTDLSPVKSFRPNRLGLYDMSGNALEWCADYYDENYYQYCVDKHIVKNPQNKDPNEKVVLRGGSYLDFPNRVRISMRYGCIPAQSMEGIGFRIARSSP